jgi:hypothetical protein
VRGGERCFRRKPIAAVPRLAHTRTGIRLRAHVDDALADDVDLKQPASGLDFGQFGHFFGERKKLNVVVG